MNHKVYELLHDHQSRVMIRLCLLIAVFSTAWAFAQYQTVYLQGKGMSSSYIGTLNAISSMLAIFATTLWGIIADRINSIKKTFIIVSIGSGVLYGLIAFLPADFRYAALMFMIYCPLANFMKSPMYIQMDNFTIRTCAAHRINYGAVRSIGSLTFSLSSVLLSAWVIPRFGVPSTFVLFFVLVLITIGITLRIPDPVVEKRTGQKPKLDPRVLFRNYFYVTFLIYAFIVYIAFGAEFSFFSYYLADKGIKITNLGLVLALRAIMEMPMLLIMQKLRHKFPLKWLILTASCLIGLECLGLGIIAKDMTSIIPFMILFGLGNGVNIGTIANYLYKLAPKEMRATAHSVYGACTALSGVIGNFCGGFVLRAVGASRFYLVLAGIIFSAASFFFLTIFFGRKKENPADVKD